MCTDAELAQKATTLYCHNYLKCSSISHTCTLSPRYIQISQLQVTDSLSSECGMFSFFQARCLEQSVSMSKPHGGTLLTQRDTLRKINTAIITEEGDLGHV